MCVLFRTVSYSKPSSDSGKKIPRHHQRPPVGPNEGTRHQTTHLCVHAWDPDRFDYIIGTFCVPVLCRISSIRDRKKANKWRERKNSKPCRRARVIRFHIWNGISTYVGSGVCVHSWKVCLPSKPSRQWFLLPLADDSLLMQHLGILCKHHRLSWSYYKTIPFYFR